MQDHQARTVAAPMELLVETGPEGMARVFTALFNLAMRSGREQHLGAGLHERSEGRRGYANGHKPKTVDTPVGSLTLRVPKEPRLREAVLPAVPGAREALLAGRHAAIAQMYVQGVTTRDAER